MSYKHCSGASPSLLDKYLFKKAFFGSSQLSILRGVTDYTWLLPPQLRSGGKPCIWMPEKLFSSSFGPCICWGASRITFSLIFRNFGKHKVRGYWKLCISLEKGRLSSLSSISYDLHGPSELFPSGSSQGGGRETCPQLPQSTKFLLSRLFIGGEGCTSCSSACSCWTGLWIERTLLLGFLPILSKTLTDLRGSY